MIRWSDSWYQKLPPPFVYTCGDAKAPLFVILRSFEPFLYRGSLEYQGLDDDSSNWWKLVDPLKLETWNEEKKEAMDDQRKWINAPKTLQIEGSTRVRFVSLEWNGIRWVMKNIH